jgi:histidine triad (HIT) family protein
MFCDKEVSCPFCKLIAERQDRTIVFENDSVISFMPLRPSHDGHVVIMPKTHYQDLFLIPDLEFFSLLQAAKQISAALKSLFAPPKVAVYSMGLEIEHAHLHLIPVFDPYDLTSRSEYERTAKEKSRAELASLSNAIKHRLGCS